MSKSWSSTKRFLISAAIGVGTTVVLFGLACAGAYAWSAYSLGGTAEALPRFAALFVPMALRLLLGGVVASILLAALSFRDPRKTTAAVLACLLVVPVISCWAVIMAVFWSETMPVP